MVVSKLGWQFCNCILTVLVFVNSFELAAADVVLRSIRVDDGSVPTPNSEPISTHVVGLPEIAQSQSLQSFGTLTHNLGSFSIVINAGPTLAANAPALAAFNRAADRWEAYISDPITVVVSADMATLPPNILGQAASSLLSISYSGVGGMRDAMTLDAANEGTDDAIVASLPTPANYKATLPTNFALNGNVFASKANFKALGYNPAQLDAIAGTATDVTITFSTSYNFDFDSSDGLGAGQFDFEGIAMHEIGHGLGFFSGVDNVDFILPATSNNISFTPLDMFRFRNDAGDDPANNDDFSNATLGYPRNMVPQHSAIFDQILAGSGGDIEVLVSQGVDFGDGQQASHWKDSLGLGIMDPTAAQDELLLLNANDLRALDLIGYEISVIPESGSFAMVFLAGLVAAGGIRLAAAWQNYVARCSGHAHASKSNVSDIDLTAA
jgi:hypothetical protein